MLKIALGAYWNFGGVFVEVSGPALANTTVCWELNRKTLLDKNCPILGHYEVHDLLRTLILERCVAVRPPLGVLISEVRL